VGGRGKPALEMQHAPHNLPPPRLEVTLQINPSTPRPDPSTRPIFSPPPNKTNHSALEDLIASAGLVEVMRVTNLIRKAHCVLAKERWENGKRVDIRQHTAGAAKRGLPFLLIRGHRLELLQVLQLLRPMLIKRTIVRERPGVLRARAVSGAVGGDEIDAGAEEARGEDGGGAVQ